VTATGATSTNPSAAVTISDDDKKFAMKAMEGGIMEVTLGGLAASKATNADVKAFGERMQTDHGKADDSLKQWATSNGLDLPTQPNAETQKASDELSKKSGAAFDKAYMSAMAKGHNEVEKQFKEEKTKVKDSGLKAWIDATLPVVEEHDKLAHEILKKLK